MFKIKHNIRNVTLGNGILKSNVLEQLANTENHFLSNTTKASINAYNKNEGCRDTAKALWKNLLIDAIFLLKVNDPREKLYTDSKAKLAENKEAFSNAFDEIRKISTYGIDELSTYFDDFVEFESVLYGTEDYYRDHIHHVLKVWALGIGLLYGLEPVEIRHYDGFENADSKYDFHFEIEEENKGIQITCSEIWAMWTIIALCHDLGYPLEKTAKINEKVKKIVNHFGCLNFSDLNFKFDLLNSYNIEKFLDVISSKVSLKDERIIRQDKYHQKLATSLEDLRHGMFSGLLTFKKLTYFLETDFTQYNDTLPEADLRQFYIRKEILRAICGHTCPKIYHLHVNTLSFLLILCDELQDWGRPRFDELLNGNRENELHTTKIKEFSVAQGKTTVYIQCLHGLKLDKRGDGTKEWSKKTESILKYYVTKRYKDLHYLLRSAKGDTERTVSLIWEVAFENYTYFFEFSSENSSYEMFKTFFVEKGKDTASKEMEEARIEARENPDNQHVLYE